MENNYYPVWKAKEDYTNARSIVMKIAFILHLEVIGTHTHYLLFNDAFVLPLKQLSQQCH